MNDDPTAQAPETGTPAKDGTTEDKGSKTVDASDQQVAPGGAADDQAAKPVTPDWPEDWREKMAGGDEKALKRLQRYKSPVDVDTARRAAEQRISSGEMKLKLADDATEEQIATYRAENGIPENPDGYLEALPDGLVIGDDDKEIVNSFLGRAHGKNADPAVVADMLDWYYKQQEEVIAAEAEADKANSQAGEDQLRAEWGGEYRGNMNSMLSFMDTAGMDANGDPIGPQILNSRMPDGTRMIDSPAAVKFLASMADAANPAGFIAPGSGMSQIDSIDAELADIEGLMRTDRPAYDKNPKMQARYLDLLTAKERVTV